MESQKEWKQYGDYIKCEASEIQKAKALMLEDMIATIRELAKRDDFFIIKTPEDFQGDPLSKCLGTDGYLKEGEITVGWKIAFLQMQK